MNEKFDIIVSLYRSLGCPKVEGNSFEYEGALSEESELLLDELRSHPDGLNYVSLFDPGDIKTGFEIQLPAGDEGKFYTNLDELVSRSPCVSKGELPTRFYLIDDNWCSTDTTTLMKVDVLRDVCDLIKCLSRLAISVDDESSPYYNNLFFAIPGSDGTSPKTFVVKTKVVPEMLEARLNHLALIRALVDDKHEGKLHIEERRMIFQLALSDILSKETHSNNSFVAVVSSWGDLISEYWQNLQSYVHGFAFDKIRTEIASAELDFSTRLSSALSDIGGKLLALPVSLAALPYLSAEISSFPFVLICMALFMVTIIMLSMVLNQILIVSRLSSSFDVVFEQFRNKIKSPGYPRSLSSVVNQTVAHVERQQKLLRIVFLIFLLISLVPAICAFYVLNDRFSWVSYIVEFVFSSSYC